MTTIPKMPAHPTAPVPPKVDLDGRKVEDDVLFFHFPQGIGDIIAGHSDLKKSKKPASRKVWIENLALAIALGLGIGFGIHKIAAPENMGYVIAGYIVPVIVTTFFAYALTSYMGFNYYIGKHGFAMFRCVKTADHLADADEIRFEDATDVYFSTVEKSQNLVYQHTTFDYEWYDRRTGQKVYTITGDFDKRKASVEYDDAYKFALAAERRHTEYLIENMPSELSAKGHVAFFLRGKFGPKHEAYVQISPSKITFSKGKGEEVSYDRADIQKVSLTMGNLVIQHKNFERKLLIFRKGNEDHIPLDAICNRKYFVFAFEKLMGYRL